MSAAERAPSPKNIAELLLAMAEGQTRALDAEDLASFAGLAAKRDKLLPLLQRPIAPEWQAGVRAALQRVLQIDQQNTARLERMRAETLRALQQLRQGRQALNGYGRPGAYLSQHTAGLDRQS